MIRRYVAQKAGLSKGIAANELTKTQQLFAVLAMIAIILIISIIILKISRKQ